MFRKLRTVLFGMAAVMSVACTATGDDGYQLSGSGRPGVTSTETGQDDSDGNDDGIKLDIGNGSGGDGPNIDPDGYLQSCKNIDFLFVIDNSGSMSDNQVELVASFPGFVDGIENLIPELESIHLGVVTTDDFSDNPGPCQKLGALVTTTENDYCGPYADGHNYMTENDDLAASFTCAGLVGASGSGQERPIEATIQALEGFLNSPGQCNEGFNRDDALLVIVIITDEDAYYSQSIQTSFEHLMYLEGMEQHVVVLALTNVEQPNLCNTQWSNPSVVLQGFTDLFTNGFMGDICAPSFEGFFEDALNVIDLACEELPNPNVP